MEVWIEFERFFEVFPGIVAPAQSRQVGFSEHGSRPQILQDSRRIPAQLLPSLTFGPKLQNRGIDATGNRHRVGTLQRRGQIPGRDSC